MKIAAATIFALLIVAIPGLHGQMVFEKQLVEVQGKPDDNIVTAEFPFTIKGDQPITIKQYEAVCSCLAAEISEDGKLVWKPGEKGTVKGIFKMGTFKGTVDKLIVLRLAEQAAPVKLTVRVHIPVLVEIDPPTLFWDLEGEAKPQKFQIKVKHDKPIKITDISGTNEQFGHEFKTIKEGREYEVVVTPKTVRTRAFGLLRIRTDCEFKNHQSVQGFLVVRRPKPVPPAGGKRGPGG